MSVIVAELLKRKNKKRFINKNPAHSVRIKLLLKAFPDALFINIIRDGRAVVSSMIGSIGRVQNVQQYFGVPLKKNNQMNYDLIERHARQWIEINQEIQNMKNSLDKNQYYEIKYEDFVINPREHMRDIFKFCDLEPQDIFEKPNIQYSGEKFNTITDKLQSRNDKWKKDFSNSEISRLEEIMGEMLQRFEYA